MQNSLNMDCLQEFFQFRFNLHSVSDAFSFFSEADGAANPSLLDLSGVQGSKSVRP